MEHDVQNVDFSYPSPRSLLPSTPSREAPNSTATGLSISPAQDEQDRKLKIMRGLENHRRSVPEDLIFDIICRLPVKLILRFRCVCRGWVQLIDSPLFINAHRQAQQRSNKTSLIFMRHLDTRSRILHTRPPSSFSPMSFISHPSSFDYPPAPTYRLLYLLEMENGKGKIVFVHGIKRPCEMLGASNGLVLLKLDKPRLLVVLNPITRKFTSLPPGRMPTSEVHARLGNLYYESYAITFVSTTSDYKLFHLVRDKLGYVHCETLMLSSRSWKHVVDWPRFKTYGQYGRVFYPVEAIGALHWPSFISGHTILSVGVEDNKFYETKLPKDQAPLKLLEVEGSLCCAFSDRPSDSIEIWMRKGLSGTGDDQWMKHCTIGSAWQTTPIFYLKDTKELVTEIHTGVATGTRVHDFVEMPAYDFRAGTLRRLEIEGDREVLKFNKFAPTDFWSFRFNRYLPHIDCLTTWKS